MTIAKRFGANLARCRKEAGLSQEEASYRAFSAPNGGLAA
jgi:hypothetical protein